MECPELILPIILPPPSVEALLLLVERYTNQLPGYHLRFCWKWRHSAPQKVYLIRTFILTGFSGTAAAAKSLQSCLTHVRPHRWQPTRLPHPWDSPGKNTGVGCHFLLQCMKVKSESEATQSCLTLCDPMDCSLPGSSVHGFSRQGYWSGVPLPSQSQGLVYTLKFEEL